jgi:hypothetical protein
MPPRKRLFGLHERAAKASGQTKRSYLPTAPWKGLNALPAPCSHTLGSQAMPYISADMEQNRKGKGGGTPPGGDSVV